MPYSFVLTSGLASRYRALRYDASAEPRCCQIPLGTIYWPDEHPGGKLSLAGLDHQSRDSILRLSAARLALWQSGAIPRDLQVLWEEARAVMPEWPGFRRLELSEQARRVAVECERSALEWFDALAEASGGLRDTDLGGGLSHWSATIRLDGKEHDHPKGPRPE